MTDPIEETTAAPRKARKAATKKAPKKAAKKTAAKKAPAKKVAAEKTVKTASAADATTPARRGRPPGKNKGVTKRRTKKGAKQFAYMLLTNDKDGTPKANALQGPFSTESDALDDAGIMADDNTTIVVFRETKRGRVQKQTKFVAGR